MRMRTAHAYSGNALFSLTASHRRANIYLYKGMAGYIYTCSYTYIHRFRKMHAKAREKGT